MSDRKKLLYAIFAILLPVTVAHAGDVVLNELDPRAGTVKEIARGKMKHEPAFVVTPGDLFLIDACGDVVGLREDRYGDRTLGEPVISDDPALKELLAVDHTGAWGMGRTGTLYQFAFNSHDSRRGSEVRTFNDEPIPEARVFIHGDQEKPMFIDDRGNLVEIRTSGTSISGLRRVEGVSGLTDVSGGIRTSFFKSGKLIPVLLLVKNDGSAVSVDLADDSNKLMSRQGPQPFAGDFAGTVLMFRAGEDDQTLVRITDSGKAYRVDFAAQTQEEIALPAKVHGRAIGEDNRRLVYASTSGTFDACAAPAVAAPAEAGRVDDKGVFKLIERMEATYDRNLPFFDKMEGGANGMSTLQNEQLVGYFTPYREAIAKFRAEEEGQIQADIGYMNAEFGGENGMARFLSEITDGKVRDFSWKINELINRYEEYRDEMVPSIAQSLSSRADIAVQIAEFKGADKTAEKMALYETALKAASWAHFFDPELPGPDELKAQMGAAKAAAEEGERKALEENTWPGRYARYTGGHADRVEAAALEYMQTKYPGEIVKVAIAGDWYVYKEDVFGHPISYCVPLHVGMKNRSDATRGYVNTGAICTQENKTAPPFNHYAWLSESRIIRIERLH